MKSRKWSENIKEENDVEQDKRIKDEDKEKEKETMEAVKRMIQIEYMEEKPETNWNTMMGETSREEHEIREGAMEEDEAS